MIHSFITKPFFFIVSWTLVFVWSWIFIWTRICASQCQFQLDLGLKELFNYFNLPIVILIFRFQKGRPYTVFELFIRKILLSNTHTHLPFQHLVFVEFSWHIVYLNLQKKRFFLITISTTGSFLQADLARLSTSSLSLALSQGTESCDAGQYILRDRVRIFILAKLNSLQYVLLFSWLLQNDVLFTIMTDHKSDLKLNVLTKWFSPLRNSPLASQSCEWNRDCSCQGERKCIFIGCGFL